MSKIPFGKKGLFVAIDRDLYHQFKQHCETEKRSLNKQMEIILEDFFRQLERKKEQNDE